MLIWKRKILSISKNKVQEHSQETRPPKISDCLDQPFHAVGFPGSNYLNSILRVNWVKKLVVEPPVQRQDHIRQQETAGHLSLGQMRNSEKPVTYKTYTII